MVQQIKRHVAYKVWINSIVNGDFVKQEGWDPNYIELDGKQISRVNIMATVVGKFLSEDGNYGAITLDDGSDTIRCKAFGPDVIKLKDVEIGSIVRFIGKVREYNEEIHLSPEVVRKIDDANWVLAWNLELGKPLENKKIEEKKLTKPIGKETQKEEKETEEAEVMTISSENFSSKILDIIKNLDGKDGADIMEVIKQSKLEEDEAKNIIAGLLKAGDIFEPKKGLLKPLD